MTPCELAECEQAAKDLATVKASLLAAIGGGQIIGQAYADKSIRYGSADVTALQNERRRLQGIVDRCNGCRSRQRFIPFQASDGDMPRGCCK